MFKKLFKLISYLIVLGISVSYNLFTIWGLVIWYETDPWISNRVTLILLGVPTLIVLNVIFLVVVSISFFNLFKKEEEKKEFKMPDKMSQWFKGEKKKEKEEFKLTEEIGKSIMKEMKKEDFKIPQEIVEWFKTEVKKEDFKIPQEIIDEIKKEINKEKE